MKNAQSTCTSAHAQKHMQSLKNGINCKRTEITKWTLVDVLVDRHSDRRANRPNLTVSFYFNVRPGYPGPEKPL